MLPLFLLGAVDRENMQRRLQKASPAERVEIWQEIAASYGSGYQAKTDSCYRRAIAEARQLDEPTLLGDATFNFGRHLYYLSELDSATHYLMESLGIREELADSSGIGRCLSHLGLIYWLTNDHLHAREYLERALAIQKSQGNQEEQGKILTNIGNMYRQWGDYREALKNYIAALDLYQEAHYTEGIAWLNFSLGMLYKNLSEYAKALDYFTESLKHYQILAGEDNDTGGIRICYSQMGDIHRLSGDLNQALEDLLRALELQKQSGVKISIADGKRRIAQVYYEMGEYDQALDYAESAQEIRRSLTDLSGNAINLLVLGQIYNRMGQTDKSLSAFREGLLYARSRGDKPHEVQILKSMADIYANQGKPDSAYQYLSLHATVRDSVFNDQVSSRIAALQVQYDLKEQTIRNQQLERDVRINELELSRQKTLRNFMTIIILLAAIILLVLVILYWNKSRDHRLIVQAHDDLAHEIEERKAVEKEREILIRKQQEALDKIRTLSGLIPICSNCKKIRNDQGYYEQLEKYIMDHSDAIFSHGICPECLEKLYPQFAKRKRNSNKTPEK